MPRIGGKMGMEREAPWPGGITGGELGIVKGGMSDEKNGSTRGERGGDSEAARRTEPTDDGAVGGARDDSVR